MHGTEWKIPLIRSVISSSENNLRSVWPRVDSITFNRDFELLCKQDVDKYMYFQIHVGRKRQGTSRHTEQ